MVNNALVEGGYKALSFFSFTPVGLVCVVVGVIVLMPLTKWFLSKPGTLSGESAGAGKSLKTLVKEYGISNSLHRLQVSSDSKLLGRMIVELNARSKYGMNILEVRRVENSQNRLLKKVIQIAAESDTVLSDGDILFVTGNRENVHAFANEYNVKYISEDKGKSLSLDFYDIGVAEIVLMPSSSFLNKKIKEAEFRTRYNVNILGICRKGKYIVQGLAEETIHGGDLLLVQGTWDNIANLETETNEWIVVGRPLEEAAKVTLDYKAPLAAGIMLLMIAAMVFDFIPIEPVTAVMIAGLLMVLTGCFRNVEAAYKTINWESIVLIAAMMPMSIALEKTGVSAYISDTLVSNIGAFGPVALMAGIYFTTSLMTMFISNTATAVLLAPIAMSSAVQLDVNPTPFLIAVAVAASMCFASPFSTPPNALVMHAGQYKFMDYVKVGLPLQIIMAVVMIFVLPLLLPF